MQQMRNGSAVYFATLGDPNRYYPTIDEAQKARQIEWEAMAKTGAKLSLSFFGNELAGEIGEACNVIKKLDRERMGLPGSRDTKEHLAEELADGMICIRNIAIKMGIDIDKAVMDKFNATSEKVGLFTRVMDTFSTEETFG